MLSLYRRHEKGCPHAAKGRAWVKCQCPIWVDGKLPGEKRRYGRSLGLRDWQRAIRRLAVLESAEGPRPKAMTEAIEEWQAQLEVADSTRRRYGRILRRLREFCRGQGVALMAELGLAELDGFRASRRAPAGMARGIVGLRPLARSTSGFELQVLRQFLGFCVERRWAERNWAKKIKPPKPMDNEVAPYTREEVAAILAACERFGQSSYERRRARAMVLLMRHTGLRISDVATLHRSRVRDGKIILHTQKTAGQVVLPVPAEVIAALDALPAPRLAASGCGYYFWNGVGFKRTAITRADRALRVVFRLSGVAGARGHRFRHTLATELLASGATLTDVADILGISETVVRRHYAKWSVQRQERIFGLMRAFQAGQAATPVLHEQKAPAIH